DRVEGGIGFLGGDLAGWAARRGVDFEELWPHAAGDDRSLWNARIFPAGSARQVIELLPWLLGGEDEARAGRERWRALPRVSMDDVRGNFDLRRWRRYEQTLREDVVARNLAARLLEGGDLQFWLEQASATRNISGVAQGVRQLARRERAPLVAARLWQLSAQLGRTDAGAGGPVVEGDNGAARDQQRAFRSIQTAVGLLSSRRAGSGAWREPAGTAIKVTAPVRIDLAGGWTDTPPQAIERGGTVLNLAITLDGVLPVQARVTVLDAPRIELAAQDHRMELTLTDAESLCEYSELSSAFALHKAAICELGLVPNRGDDLESYLQGRGGGFRLETSARVPMGSGLGTSSILGAAVLAALGGLVGPELDLRRLSRQVLQLEQRLTSGGGWQDQVGALTGGFKVARTPPGRDQTPTVEQLAVPPDVVREFEERLVVYFTGLPRLARNVLQRVVARYLLRDPAVEAALAEMPDLVERLRLALLGGRLDEVGECLSRSWHLNQQIEPTASNPAVERLFEAVKPYAAGAKLAGAGGGGFIIVLAREPRLAEKIRATIREAGGAPDGEYQARVSTEGISTRKGAA
ncbi:MAG TPA: hypothetical protein VK689_00805, partial [Armatimonadota bacterium]|nr:hypothetical protein [Armatimonadota bacterium]